MRGGLLAARRSIPPRARVRAGAKRPTPLCGPGSAWGWMAACGPSLSQPCSGEEVSFGAARKTGQVSKRVSPLTLPRHWGRCFGPPCRLTGDRLGPRAYTPLRAACKEPERATLAKEPEASGHLAALPPGPPFSEQMPDRKTCDPQRPRERVQDPAANPPGGPGGRTTCRRPLSNTAPNRAWTGTFGDSATVRHYSGDGVRRRRESQKD